ncbi:hypothetical protein OJAV_G00224980 [Oryzias javanicus]|uniref:Secreted protein n=1 Tax=Oryzias javanicus TaxID=123683 RepID=A0A3S2LZ54_ORYJA|nr:hypothetical protein OJAV_G00224980 [Oryzias javanicus]
MERTLVQTAMMKMVMVMMMMTAQVLSTPLPTQPQSFWPDDVTIITPYLVNTSDTFGAPISRLRFGCFLSVCATSNLGNDLQTGGDEVAGKSSSDAFGPGK